MTFAEAAQQGIRRVSRLEWKDGSYLKLDRVAGRLGPWGHLYSPTQAVIGEPTPQDVLLIYTKPDDGYEAYTGPLFAEDTP